MIDFGRPRRGLWIAAMVFGVCSCKAPGGPDNVKPNEFGPPRDAAVAPPVLDGDIAMVTSPLCSPLKSSEPMPSRSTIASATAASQTATMFTSDLFERFSKVCGTCHVQCSLGGFAVTASTFKIAVTKTVLDNSIEQDDPTKFMPPQASPNGMPFSQRTSTDPVKELADLLEQWIAQGSPADAFDVSTTSSDDAPPSYAMSEALGAQMTNIGTCVPDKGMVGTSTNDIDRLDAFFTQATALPDTLDKTDLVTLDSETLAKNRVISYAPTYPLWTDNAGKMRYIRVPSGQAVTFDKTTQKFTIPPNTRFYKTFLKSVVDANGNTSFRKIETRMIVSRPDTTLTDGTIQQNALYGTYVWNDDESQAILQADPLNDGKPFADRLKTYVTDEQKAQPIIDGKPADLEKALTRAGLLRHYALPGAERCVHCHMGSASASFVLGFMPLQIARRPTGTSGVIEPGMGDELTQLQRFIDYGIIKGMTSPADVLPLEKSQGTRAPRNDAELTAQAYMLGNCSHCHNPRGFPSTKEPALKDVLNFLPSATTGGIFQFPLDRVSPTRKRGINHEIDMPYITPALYDQPSDRSSDKFFCPQNVDGGGVCVNDTPEFIMAPWRSLIYRNVDTPYDYFDDATPFPHMPLDSPGYDCRAKTILGDWMVGITAALKDESKPLFTTDYSGQWQTTLNVDPQPYAEAKPGDANYNHAVLDTNTRMFQYHNGHRYKFCPPDYTADIVDPVIQDEVDRGVAVTTHSEATIAPNNTGLMLMSDIGVPAEPNWVNFDDTDPPGDWFPRRADWQTFLTHPNIPAAVASLTTKSGRTEDTPTLTNVLTALETVTLDANTRSELTKPIPFGLWQPKATCDFSSEPKASAFTGADRPAWMAVANPDPAAPVYVESLGAAVFTTICYNCHGVQADSKGLLADEISIFTGGAARVANFRDGLFGPIATPGANRTRVFTPALQAIGGGATVDDVTARYMAFMALGGTDKHLPNDVLAQVAETPVLGVLRTNAALAGTPDMLRLGLELCQQVALADLDVAPKLSDFANAGRFSWSKSNFGLIESNGDAEMWLRLCSLGNRPIVRALTASSWSSTTSLDDLNVGYYSEYWGASETGDDWYGPNPVMDHRGQLKTGLTSDNWFPLCVQKPTAAADVAVADKLLQAHPVGGAGGSVIPYCPAGFATTARLLSRDPTDYSFIDGPKWAARGAINAALAVFLYLDGIEHDPSKRQPLFDQCELIGK